MPNNFADSGTSRARGLRVGRRPAKALGLFMSALVPALGLLAVLPPLTAFAAVSVRCSVTPSAATGYNHGLALGPDGTAWAWGTNYAGELGNGTQGNYSYDPTPGHVHGLAALTAVAGGGDLSLALKQDGTVWAWGYNGYGQLGDGTVTDRHLPQQVTGLPPYPGHLRRRRASVDGPEPRRHGVGVG